MYLASGRGKFNNALSFTGEGEICLSIRRLRPVSCYPSLQMNKCFTQPYQRRTPGCRGRTAAQSKPSRAPTSTLLRPLGEKKKKSFLKKKREKTVTFFLLFFLPFPLGPPPPPRAQGAHFYISEHLPLCRFRRRTFARMPLDSGVKQL